MEPGAAERERLILLHLPQVRLIARSIHERLPPDSVSLEDLVSSGTLGLIAAIDRFDPSQNVKLKTYAERKIRGAILDSLRELDWAPRTQRHKSKKIQGAIAAVEQRVQRAPAEEEIAAELDLTLEEYRGWLLDLRGLHLATQRTARGSEPGQDPLRTVAADQDETPSRILERAELKRLVSTGVQRMPRIERTVLTLYYFQERSMREIAETLELHESRVSQLKCQAIPRLRSYIEKRWPTERGL